MTRVLPLSVLKTVEKMDAVARFSFVDVTVVLQRQVPTIQTAQKTRPKILIEVDVHVQRQVPMIRKMPKNGGDPPSVVH